VTLIQKILIVLFGASWRTSLISYLGAVAILAAQALAGRTEPGWVLLALALAALGRAAKDSGVTGGTTVASNASIVTLPPVK
jgi:hypothetical protein